MCCGTCVSCGTVRPVDARACQYFASWMYVFTQKIIVPRWVAAERFRRIRRFRISQHRDDVNPSRHGGAATAKTLRVCPRLSGIVLLYKPHGIHSTQSLPQAKRSTVSDALALRPQGCSP